MKLLIPILSLAAAVSLVGGCSSSPTSTAVRKPKPGAFVRVANLTQAPVHVSLPDQPVGNDLQPDSALPYIRKRVGKFDLSIGSSAAQSAKLAMELTTDPQTIYLTGSSAKPSTVLLPGDLPRPKEGMTSIRAVNLTGGPLDVDTDGARPTPIEARQAGPAEERSPGSLRVRASRGGKAVAEKTIDTQAGITYTAVLVERGGKVSVVILESKVAMEPQVMSAGAAG